MRVGRRQSSVMEALTNGELPPQFDSDGLITSGTWQDHKTSLTHTAWHDTPPVFSHIEQDWRDDAACRGNPAMVNLMFTHQCTYECTSNNGRVCKRDASVSRAKRVCAECPVLDRCRWWAVVTNLTDGVAGGLTYAERLSIRKALRKDEYGSMLIEGVLELCPEQ